MHALNLAPRANEEPVKIRPIRALPVKLEGENFSRNQVVFRECVGRPAALVRSTCRHLAG